MLAVVTATSLLLACGGSSGEDMGFVIRRDLGPVEDEGMEPRDMGPPAPDEGMECFGLSDPDNGRVLTTEGEVQGEMVEEIWAFKGVPYAAPPTGSRRFRAPAAFGCHSSAFVADDFGSVCPQLDTEGEVVGDEDCLTINIWSPDLTPITPRAVVLFIHGGSHDSGSSADPILDGAALAAGRIQPPAIPSTVVVTFNYRLGPLGYLAHPDLTAEGGERASGNYGTLDQRAALRWVRDNIERFGGDPNKIMLVGQGAGASAVCALAANDETRPLFTSAAIMSGTCTARTLEEAESDGEDVAGEVGCGGSDDVPGCLRGLDAGTLISTQADRVPEYARFGPDPYREVVDDFILTDPPLTMIEGRGEGSLRLIVGSTTGETGVETPRPQTAEDLLNDVAAFFSNETETRALEIASAALQFYPPANNPGQRRTRWIEVTTDAKYTCWARQIARSFTEVQDPMTVYRYYFIRTPADEFRLVPVHGIDLGFLFGTRPFPETDTRSISLSRILRQYWVSMAENGVPSSPNTAAWDSYRLNVGFPERTIELGTASGTLVPDPEPDVRMAECDFWDGELGERGP